MESGKIVQLSQGKIRFYFSCIAMFAFIVNCALASDHVKSLVLKNHSPERDPFYFQMDNSKEELWNEFMLMKNANSGDPIAQHELGLRYLIGKGFSADTEKAAQWIRKAADQNLAPAQYNMGILLNNGWGTDWNPFEAYKRFKYAATHYMVEAQYVFGLLLTDNLVVSRNYPEAYRWIKAAADSGYVPAKEALVEFRKRGINISSDSVAAEKNMTGGGTHSQHSNQKPSASQLIDSISEPETQTLMQEALLEGGARLKNVSQGGKVNTINDQIDSANKRLILDAAEAGSPEALILVGRWYEQEFGTKRDVVKATVYYLRAMRLESPWAPRLLQNMIQGKEYFRLLKARVDENDPSAQFAWAGLISFGLDNQLTGAQALELLRNAATRNFSPALVELALCYYTGTWVKQDREKAEEYLRLSARLGNREGAIRLSMIELAKDKQLSSTHVLVESLRKAFDDGSVLAQEMLGYCYQKGLGVPYNKSESVRWYREAAQRGSTAAYDALRNMYDEIRPKEAEFKLHDNEVMN